MATKKSTTKNTRTKTANKNYKAEYEQRKRAKRQMNAVILFTIGLLLVFIAAIKGSNVWSFMHDCLYGLFGLTAWAIPISLIYISIMTSLDKPIGEIKHKVWQMAIMVTLICSLVELCSKLPFGAVDQKFFDCFPHLYQNGVLLKGGGVFSLFLGYPLLQLCGKAGAIIIVSLLLFAFLMLLTGSTLIGFFKTISKPVIKIEETYSQKREEQEKKSTSTFNIDVDLGPEANMPEHPVSSPKPSLEDLLGIEKPKEEKEKKQRSKAKTTTEDSTEAVKQPLDELVKKLADNDPEKNNLEVPAEPKPPIIDEHEQSKLYADENNNISRYIFPPISLLKASKNVANRDVSEELKSNAELLVDTLKSFGVQTKIIDISRGPTVTRYELQPSAGVKISKITGLSDDIALNLAVAGVRIEAPIPNKAAVGIEVPNKQNEVVTMREIIESPEFENAKSKVSVALGKDIAGNFAVTDIAKMPHLLIAGTTGSGKSVCINSIIISLLYKASPSEVRFLMIDPKVVELGVYNGIPHLLVPVVTDPRKASGALSWAVNEMLNRYKLFAENNVRDIKSYNKLAEELDRQKEREKLNESSDKKEEIEEKTLDPLPQIVIVIDELADLMMAAPNEVEDSICRLAQMARAAGMHLIIATQRPSVDVITGLIKTNIPSRIAFKVSSQVDSRIILDTSGAEKLLGNGDMLFNPVGNSKPLRVQGCYVSDKEISQVVDFIKNKAKADYDDKIIEEIDKQAAQEKGSAQGTAAALDDSDELLSDAIECVIEAGQASTSYLQRKLKVGYARAARLMDEMEEKGIIGAFEGSKPRQVLISRQQWIEMKMNNEE